MSEFLHGDLPQGFQFSFEPSIFNTSLHRSLQSAEDWESFYLIDEQKKIVLAAIYFNVNEAIARSPLKASFGGMELDNQVEQNQLCGFLEFIGDKLVEKGVRKIIVKQAPSFLEDENVIQSFLNAGFTIRLIETDSFIKIEGPYDIHLHPRKSKKLRSLLKSDFQVQQLSLDQLPLVYDLILRAREQKSYGLSMTLQQLNELVSAFSKNIFLFSVTNGDKMIAASICIQVKNNWLYDFYHDHDSAYDSHSPIVLLMNVIYSFCLDQSIQWLELGTSMRGAEVNELLLLFKERLGGIPVKKITFEKTLDS